MSSVQRGDFYTHASVLHPIVVGIPLTIAVWLYLRFTPNRLLTALTKFDYIFGITFGSTLSRVITGSATTLDLTRGAISLAVIVIFQLGLAYMTTILPTSRNWVRVGPRVVVFRGRMLMREMKHNAIIPQDVRIGMRRVGVLNLSEIEVLLLEASGAFSVVTRAQIEKAGQEPGSVPDCLVGIPHYAALCAAEKEKHSNGQDSNFVQHVDNDMSV